MPAENLKKKSSKDKPSKPTGAGVDSKTRSQTKSAAANIERYAKHHEKLDKERAQLDEKMRTDQEDSRLHELSKQIGTLARGFNQDNATGAGEQAAAQQDAMPVGENPAVETLAGENLAVQNPAVQNPAVQNPAVQHPAVQPAVDTPAEENLAVQNPAVGTLAEENPVGVSNATMHHFHPEQGQVKQEPREDPATKTLVDDLNMAWNVNVEDEHVEPWLQNLEKDAFGHLLKGSTTRYCVRYGSSDAYSARFESMLPTNSKYQRTRDVTQRSNRIIERIVQIHRDRREPLPMEILSKAKVLVVYWDSKLGVGHAADVEVLAPDFKGRRPHTRCFVYLDPVLYSKYNLENKTGYSHETRSIMKLTMEGNDDWQRSVTFYNEAVRLENNFEAKYMKQIPDRPDPLFELVRDKTITTRRAGSRSASAKAMPNPRPQRTPMPPSKLPDPSPDRIGTEINKEPSGRPSLREEFHADYLDALDLPPKTTYEQLPEEGKLHYFGQFRYWKKVNSTLSG